MHTLTRRRCPRRIRRPRPVQLPVVRDDWTPAPAWVEIAVVSGGLLMSILIVGVLVLLFDRGGLPVVGF